MESILIVDDDGATKDRLSRYFEATASLVDLVDDASVTVQCLERRVYDLVILDLEKLGPSLDRILRSIKSSNSDAVTIVLCDRESSDDAIKAVRLGASDFVLKPVNVEELEIRVQKGIALKRLWRESQALRGERPLIYRTRNFIGESSAMRRVLSLVEKVAKSSSSVILLGETGTGKELLAGAIHYNSPRAESPFVRVSCATLPDTLMESELFGHERGAFTGALKLRIGRFEQGNGGSVFLDEVADVTIPSQAKLLRVLQEKEFERLGSNRTVKVDVRLISATNKNLHEEIAEGRFREDLYYRLSVVTIRVPPLRERIDDLEPLVEFFLGRFGRRLEKKIRMIDPAAMRLLKEYHWPGNVRELENTLERAVLLAEGDVIRRQDLGLPMDTPPGGSMPAIRVPRSGIKWETIEREWIVWALRKSNWVQKNAASLLGLSPRVLNYKIKQLGIRHARWKKNS